VPAGPEAALPNGGLSTLGASISLGDCDASGSGASASESDVAGGSGSGGIPSEVDDDSDRRIDSSFELV
jgi:hypothetical protein